MVRGPLLPLAPGPVETLFLAASALRVAMIWVRQMPDVGKTEEKLNNNVMEMGDLH
jgi:hypothetical protein